MDAELAYQLVHDELMLDGNARLNLATFVTTWMEPQASRLMSECADKNMIDKDEYPRTAELERRCVRMLAQLWSAPDPDAAPGCSTTGSSEAIGVVAVLGSTFDGSYEPVAQICAALDELAAAGGPDVPVHVDGDPER
jgi:glutamate decarboxylase